MKQPVTFQNSPDVTFAGSLAYLGAMAICSLGILLLCLGYPEWMTIGGLFLASLTSVILSHHYLSRSFGSLHIGPQGMEYFPVAGEKTSFRWRELGRIKVLPGWLRVYDRQGKKIFSYTYGLGRQHALINAIAKQMGNRKIRPVIWPDVVSTPAAAKKTARKSKKGAGTSNLQGAHKEEENHDGKSGTHTSIAPRNIHLGQQVTQSEAASGRHKSVRRSRQSAAPVIMRG